MFCSNQDTKLVSDNKKEPTFKISWLIGGILLIVVALFIFFSFSSNTVKSDEDLIHERIEKLVSSYNSGDNEGIMECFDEYTKRIVARDTKNLSITCNDNIFGLDELLGEDDLVQIRNIEFTVPDGESKVDVHAEAVVYESNTRQIKSDYSRNVSFHMVKEYDDWFIHSMAAH